MQACKANRIKARESATYTNMQVPYIDVAVRPPRRSSGVLGCAHRRGADCNSSGRTRPSGANRLGAGNLAQRDAYWNHVET